MGRLNRYILVFNDDEVIGVPHKTPLDAGIAKKNLCAKQTRRISLMIKLYRLETDGKFHEVTQGPAYDSYVLGSRY